MLTKIRWRAGRGLARRYKTKRSAREERGATLVEYALLLGLIAVTAVGSLVLVGKAVSNTATKVGDQILTLGNANDTIGAVSGAPQQVTVGTAFAGVVASVTNQNGGAVGGFAITFTIQSLTGGASATFTGACSGTTCVVPTGANGQAATPAFTANTKAGTFSVTAGAAGLVSTATFTPLTNLPDTAHAVMTIVSPAQPMSAQVGNAFGALEVHIQDPNGNPVVGQNVVFTAPTGGASGTFATGGTNTTTVATDSSGDATTSIFTANHIAGQNYTIGAVATGTPIPGVNFTATNRAGPAALVTAIAGTPQSADTSTAFVTNLEVLVTDTYGNPVSTATVTFTAPATTVPSGLFANNTITTTATTDTNGDATASTFTANAHASPTGTPYTVTAKVGALAPANFSLTNLTLGLGSYLIVIEQGNNQSATVNTAFPTDFRVELESLLGGVPNAQITFTAAGTPASGTFSGTCTGATCQVTTPASGFVSASTFTANGIPGTYNITVSAANAASIVMTETNLASGGDTMTIVGGNNQSQTLLTAFPNALEVQILNATSQPVVGTNVTFTAPANAGDPSGTFGGACGGSHTCTVATNAAGDATAPAFTAGLVAGTYNVTASATGVPTVSFTETNSQYAMTLVEGSPQAAQTGKAFTDPLVVEVTGALGLPQNGINVVFTAPATGASGKFSNGSNTITIPTAGGDATAPFTANTTAGGPYTVTATVTGAAGSPVDFSLTNEADGLKIIAGNNQTTTVGTGFATQLEVEVIDGSGNPVTTSTTVTFTAPTTGASGTFLDTMTNTTQVTTSTGYAQATVFSANLTTGTYTVKATAPSAGDADFTETNANYTITIVNNGGNNQSTAIGTAFANPLEVHVNDPGNGPVANDAVTFTAPNTGDGIFSNSTDTITVNTDGGGNAVAPFTAGATPGTYGVGVTAAGSTGQLTFTETNLDYVISATAGTPQTALINAQYTTNLQVQVLNDANPVPNVAVTFTAPGNGASGEFFSGGCFLTPTCTVNTNNQGFATAPAFYANGTAGAFTVTASTPGAPTPANFSLTNGTYVVAVVSGTPQTAADGAQFTNPLVVSVTLGGNPAPAGVDVTFTAPANGASGTFANGTRTTTVQTVTGGDATSTAFTANATAGAYNVTATAPGSNTVNFAMTNEAYVVAVVSGTPQSAAHGTQFGLPLVVSVTLGGNPAPAGVNVTFTAPANGASGTFANGTRTTTVQTVTGGDATSTAFTANGTTGSYNVTATAPGSNTVNFALKNT